MGSSLRGFLQVSAIGLVSAILAGCSMGNFENPFMASANANGKPTVWDCSVVQMSSPPRYACSDNKTYTAFQLRDARLGVEAPPKVASK